MRKTVDSFQVKEGDIIRTTRGNMVVMYRPRNNRRCHLVIEGVYESTLPKMMKEPKNTKVMHFIKWTLRGRDRGIDVVGSVSQSTVKMMKEMHQLLNDVLEEKRSKNMDALDLTWNDKAIVKKRTQYHGTRLYQGTYDVTTMKGEHVSAGDKVMVHFSNGNFEMIMGNPQGLTYDPKTGRFLCIDPWKADRAPRQRVDFFSGRIKTVKVKARSMAPESLLYLIAKKGAF